MAGPTVAQLQLRLQVHGIQAAANLQRALARVGGAEIRRQLDAQARSVLGIETAMKKASKAGAGFGDFLKTASRMTIVARGLFDGFSAVGGAITDALRPLRDFQSNMAKVQSKGGLTLEERDAASGAVKGMVGKTKFGAVEASEAAVGLAAAGQGKNLAGALPTVLRFAQANDIAPEKSTEILLGVMGQFGKDIKDLEMIGDMITKTDQMSVLSVSEIYDTLKYVGPLAKDAKMPLQEVLSMVSTLGDAGIKASKGGTGIRNLMFSLAKDPRRAKQANKFMHQLGMNREQFQKGLENPTQFLSKLDKQMEEKGWSPQKRIAFNQTMFGTYGSTTASALLAGSQALSKNPDGTVNTKITQDRDQIAAAHLNHTLEKQAEIMGGTLENRIANVNAKFELLKINLGERMLPVIMQVVDAMSGWADKGLNSKELTDAFERISKSLVVVLPLALKATESGLALVVPGMQKFAALLDNIAVGLASMGVIEYSGQSGSRDVGTDQGVRDKIADDARKDAWGRLLAGDKSADPSKAADQALVAFDAQQKRMKEAPRGPMSMKPDAEKSLLDITVRVDDQGGIKAMVEKLTKGSGGPNMTVRTGVPTP